MIQTISAVLAGASIKKGMLATSVEDGLPANFMAQFTKALAGKDMSEGDNAVPPTLLGSKALAVEGASTGEDVLLTLDAVKPDDGVKPDAVKPDEPSAGALSSLADDAMLLSMLGLPVQPPANGGGKQVIEPVMLDAPEHEDLVDVVEGEGGGVGTEDKPVGKKLPNALAVIAGQQKSEQPEARLDADAPVVAKIQSIAPGTGLGGLAVLNASAPTAVVENVPAPVLEAAAPAVPVAGQEAASTVIRGYATAAPQDKLVMGMQNGFGSTAWRQELGDKLVWMAGRQGQAADLILNPPSLGAVEVRLNMHGSEASAQFFSSNPNVREVIEAALPKLREMMAGAGIALGEATVSEQSFGHREKAESGKAGAGNDHSSASVDGSVPLSAVRTSGTSLLDYFA